MQCSESKKSAFPRAFASLIAAITIALGLIVVLPSGASATPTCSGTATRGIGDASLLQWGAQEEWLAGFATEVCPGKRAPRFYPGRRSIFAAYLATEAPPSATQMGSVKTETGASGGLAVIPVAQTAIAIVANPPKECAISEITNRQLELVFRGYIQQWSQLKTASGFRCHAPITRVVPQVGVGITSQFKSYLSRMNEGVLPCTGGKIWRELREFDSTEIGSPNTTWPEGCPETTKIERPESVGGGVVARVNHFKGSIGFAGLFEVHFRHAHSVLRLQNDGQFKGETKAAALAASFASPEGANGANCGGIVYHVPVGARARPGESGLNADWSQVVGANPAVGGENYPLCMLTYDLTFQQNKSNPGRSTQVHDLLKEYVTTSSGQALLEGPKSPYAPLPTAAFSSKNVLAAAQYAAGKLSP